MLKFLIGVSLIAFGSYFGYFLTRNFRKRASFFSQFREFNERFINEISYFRRPIMDFLSEYSYKNEFQMLLIDYANEIDKWNCVGLDILKGSKYDFLKNEEKAVVFDYFLMLGRGDSTSQKGYFSAVKDMILKLHTEAILARKRYGDLYIKIGFLCGLLILILLV